MKNTFELIEFSCKLFYRSWFFWLVSTSDPPRKRRIRISSLKHLLQAFFKLPFPPLIFAALSVESFNLSLWQFCVIGYSIVFIVQFYCDALQWRVFMGSRNNDSSSNNQQKCICSLRHSDDKNFAGFLLALCGSNQTIQTLNFKVVVTTGYV